MSNRRRLFGEVAVELNFLTEERLAEALRIQRTQEETGQPRQLLGEVLRDLGYITSSQVAAVRRKILGR